jgi:hypothetical protein
MAGSCSASPGLASSTAAATSLLSLGASEGEASKPC